MSNYEEALNHHGLGAMMEDRWGQWGHFSEEVALICLAIAKSEHVPAHMICFTWAEESCWNIRPRPNTNHNPDPGHWDFGPGQLNYYWIQADVALRHISYASGNPQVPALVRDNVFGSMIDVPFDGDVESNLRMMARKLRAYHGTETEQVLYYTGPNARIRRALDWQKFGDLMRIFFEEYTPDTKDEAEAQTAPEPAEAEA